MILEGRIHVLGSHLMLLVLAKVSRVLSIGLFKASRYLQNGRVGVVVVVLIINNFFEHLELILHSTT